MAAFFIGHRNSRDIVTAKYLFNLNQLSHKKTNAKKLVKT